MLTPARCAYTVGIEALKPFGFEHLCRQLSRRAFGLIQANAFKCVRPDQIVQGARAYPLRPSRVAPKVTSITRPRRSGSIDFSKIDIVVASAIQGQHLWRGMTQIGATSST